MKKIETKSLKKIILFAVLLCIFPSLGHAQYFIDRWHFNIDWQVNIPVNTSFADKASGWGTNFEGGYEVLPNWSVGAFINYHSNHRYIPRTTLHISETQTLNTDLQQSTFQLPFGLSTRYWTPLKSNHFKPYIGLKLGTMYSESSAYTSLVRVYDNPWGFYISPEIGINIRPVAFKRLGFHAAFYYNYATNKSKVLSYSVDGLNNLGFRFGVCF